jgi:hypothetical protein
MAKVRHLIIACVVSDVIDLSGSVVLSKLPETEIEVLLSIIDVIWIEIDMFSAILTHSIVTEPHIVAKACKFECCCIISI